MLAARLARQLRPSTSFRPNAARRIATTSARRSDALFVVSGHVYFPSYASMLTFNRVHSTATRNTTTPRYPSLFHFLSSNQLTHPPPDPIRVHPSEPHPCKRNRFALPSAVQKGRGNTPARPCTATEQGMDKYQRYELCGELLGDAAHACV